MSLWDRARDRVLAAMGRPARQVALALLSALRRAQARGEALHIVGSWSAVLEALGVTACGKSARAALSWLAELAEGRVVRLASDGTPSPRGRVWRLVLDAADAFVAPQLELGFGANGKVESGRGAAEGLKSAPRQDPRTRARASRLERVAGRLPRHGAARALTLALAQDDGPLDGGLVWSVTLTRGDRPIEQAAIEWCAGLDVVLVPERSSAGLLHYHGFLLGDASLVEELRARWEQCGGGMTNFTPIRDVHRLRHWASYVFKKEALEFERVGEGWLRDVADAEQVLDREREPDDQPPKATGRLARARKWLREAWRKWGGR